MSILKQIIKRIINTKYQVMQKGTVKFFNNAKGFGFIKPQDSDEDVFVHQTGLIDKIRDNDEVEFVLERGEKGMNAVQVKLTLD